MGNAQFGTQQVGGSGANDRIIFVAELGSNNQWSWATGSTSGAYQTARSIDMTGQGSLAIAGTFASVTSDGYVAQSGSASFGSNTISSTYMGMVIAGIDTTGNWQWAEVADGSFNDEGYAIATMPSGSIVSMGDHCRGGVTASGQTCSITLGSGSESTNGNYFTNPNTNGNRYAFNTGIHLWAIQADSDSKLKENRWQAIRQRDTLRADPTTLENSTQGPGPRSNQPFEKSWVDGTTHPHVGNSHLMMHNGLVGFV